MTCSGSCACEVLFNDTTLSWWWWQRVRDPSAESAGRWTNKDNGCDAPDATEIVWLVCYKDVISLLSSSFLGYLRLNMTIASLWNMVWLHDFQLPVPAACLEDFWSALRDPEDKQHPKLGRQHGSLGKSQVVAPDKSRLQTVINSPPQQIWLGIYVREIFNIACSVSQGSSQNIFHSVIVRP
jgi:hypothetical protein